MLDLITDFFNNNTMMIVFAAVALVAIVGMFMFKPKQSINSPSETSNENTLNNMMGRCDPNTGVCFPPTNEEENQNQMGITPEMQEMMQKQMIQQQNNYQAQQMAQQQNNFQSQEMMQGQEQEYMQNQEQDTM
jgi:hypothetical protein